METLRAKTPVFTDESGRRVTVLQWVARGLCATFVLVGVAVAFTLVTHVPLPGLGGLLGPSTTDSAPGAAREGTAGGERALDAGLTVGSDPDSVHGRVDDSRSGAVDRNARGSTTRPQSVVTAQAAQADTGSGEGATGAEGSPHRENLIGVSRRRFSSRDQAALSGEKIARDH